MKIKKVLSADSSGEQAWTMLKHFQKHFGDRIQNPEQSP